MTWKCNVPAYSEYYLESVVSVHRLVFVELNEFKKYDIFSLIDSYMQYSEVRKKMDEGNWSALNKGDKQLLNSIKFSEVKPNDRGIDLDGIMLGWMAEVYCRLQWKYGIYSADISKSVPAEKLCELYNPLHEVSYEKACEKIYDKYFQDKSKLKDTYEHD